MVSRQIVILKLAWEFLLNTYYIIRYNILCIAGALAKRENFRPTVTTPKGEIEGHVGLTVNLNPFYKFEGVPYAEPPVGELRFEVRRAYSTVSLRWDTALFIFSSLYSRGGQSFEV